MKRDCIENKLEGFIHKIAHIKGDFARIYCLRGVCGCRQPVQKRKTDQNEQNVQVGVKLAYRHSVWH